MTMQFLRIATHDGVAVVTIDRQDKGNALNAALIGELDCAFSGLANDASVRAVVLTGAGPKFFVAGADIGELESASPAKLGATAAYGQAVFRRIETLGKPVIAAINGFALGGGLELALSCTFRYASSNAKLGLPEINLGIMPGYGGTQRLPRLIGRGPALEMVLTGDPIDANEACRLGLVNKVFEPDQLQDAATKIATKLASKAPIATRFILDAATRGQDLALNEGLALEAALFGLIGSTADTREGLKAFLEKRPARFTGA